MTPSVRREQWQASATTTPPCSVFYHKCRNKKKKTKCVDKILFKSCRLFWGPPSHPFQHYSGTVGRKGNILYGKQEHFRHCHPVSYFILIFWFYLKDMQNRFFSRNTNLPNLLWKIYIIMTRVQEGIISICGLLVFPVVETHTFWIIFRNLI